MCDLVSETVCLHVCRQGEVRVDLRVAFLVKRVDLRCLDYDVRLAGRQQILACCEDFILKFLISGQVLHFESQGILAQSKDWEVEQVESLTQRLTFIRKPGAVAT